MGVPLPWVLGAMMGTALLTLTCVGARQPLGLRRTAQLIIGCAIGLNFTPDVLSEVLSFWPWLFLGAGFSIGWAMFFARVFQRLAGIDGPTAVYAVAVGASSEMALQAQRAGADGAIVAAAHAVRVILVVSLASVVAYFSGEQHSTYIDLIAPALDANTALGLLCLTPLAGWVAERLRLPNPWVLGPVLVAGAFAANGWTDARMDPVALLAAQILIGWSLGQHLTPEFFRNSPRVLASATLVTVSMLALCVLLAWAVSQTGRLSLLTSFLAVAPGGMAEMAIIAKTFGIGAPLVTAFHLFRMLFTVLTIGGVCRFLLRIGWVRAGMSQDESRR